jgi:hypothetical protein
MTPIILGEATDVTYSMYSAESKQIVAADCHKRLADPFGVADRAASAASVMCAAPAGPAAHGVAVVLVACTDPTASNWTKVAHAVAGSVL